MTDQFAKLREALSKIPHAKWSASKNNFTIPETEDFAGKTVGITGLDKQYARHLARYIAESDPATTAALLAHHDAHQWQPIEIAPMDGQHVLVALTDGTCCIAAYSDLIGLQVPPWIKARPTHWMSLPPAPTGEPK